MHLPYIFCPLPLPVVVGAAQDMQVTLPWEGIELSNQKENQIRHCLSVLTGISVTDCVRLHTETQDSTKTRQTITYCGVQNNVVQTRRRSVSSMAYLHGDRY